MIKKFFKKKTLIDIHNFLKNPKNNIEHTKILNEIGHRAYIGGDNSESWYGIGKRQYHFLIKNGLKSNHVFLDIACGSLRLGQYLIPMLDIGNYYGIDSEEKLIKDGIKNEILFDLCKIKKPNFSINYNFDFKFIKKYDYAIAQSLFTHLNRDDINLCFKNLAKISMPRSKFYFTFFEGDESLNQHSESHAHRNFIYEFRTLQKIAKKNNFNCKYIGDWGHERGQKIAIATSK